MDEDQIPDVLKSERLGHDEPGMRGVYGHVSPAMRDELKAAPQARWEDSLRQRAALSPVSAVPAARVRLCCHSVSRSVGLAVT
jgi:hypothetical protein